MLQEGVLAIPRLSIGAIEEELEMTFQVALIGLDGTILGSDRKMTNRSPRASDAVPFDQTEETKKFFQSPDDAIIACFAGSLSAQQLAREIVLHGDPLVPGVAWESWVHATAINIQSRGSDEVLIARKAFPTEILKAVSGVGASRVHTRVCTGAIVPASFLTQHFAQNRSVESLAKLALLTLSFASMEAPSGVSGSFDLAILTASGVQWESFGEGDARVKEIHERFQVAALASIYED